MTHLYFIRHAQAHGVVDTISLNAGLSSLGIKQAERLRDRLVSSREIQADVLLSSTLNCARETAGIIAPAFHLLPIFDQALEEMSIGNLEGLSVDVADERFGSFSPDDEPFHKLGRTGESWADFTFRACQAIDRLTREFSGRTVIIVTHSRFIECSFTYFMGLTSFKQLPIVLRTQHTSITHWEQGYFPGYERDYLQWCLQSYNDHAHLDHLATV